MTFDLHHGDWPIFGYEGRYVVSKTGVVTSLPNSRRAYAITMKAHPHRSGHLVVNLSANGIVTKHYIHRLVAFAFLGAPPQPDFVVRHLDGNPANNSVSNLAWGSAVENQRDRLTHGTDCRGEKHGRAKLSIGEVLAIRSLVESGESKASLSRKFSVSESEIRAIANRSNWKHV